MRLVSRTHKYDRITPALMDLHWLPVKRRISFNILPLTYEALNALGTSKYIGLANAVHTS